MVFSVPDDQGLAGAECVNIPCTVRASYAYSVRVRTGFCGAGMSRAGLRRNLIIEEMLQH
jgi:hypothetical protein